MNRPKEEKGATLIEFAIVVPIFFLLLFAGFDLFRVYHYKLSLKHALTKSMRTCLISQARSCPNSQALRSLINQKLMPSGLQIETSDTLTVCPVSSNITCRDNTFTTGAASDIVIYRIDKRLDLITAKLLNLQGIKITAMAMGQNEPV